jgi:hypothetical protein
LSASIVPRLTSPVLPRASQVNSAMPRVLVSVTTGGRSSWSSLTRRTKRRIPALAFAGQKTRGSHA